MTKATRKESAVSFYNQDLKDIMSLGDVFVQSGMFKDIKSQAEACVKILAGREVGLRPIQAMNEVYIVDGKTSFTAKVIAGLLVKSGRYSYTIDKLDETECTLTFYDIIDNKRVEKGKSTFTFKDAAKAGIVNKDVWKNYPRNMLFSRAMSNGQRWYAPDIFTGYTPEEIENIPERTEETILLEFDNEGNQKVKENKSNGETTVSE